MKTKNTRAHTNRSNHTNRLRKRQDKKENKEETRKRSLLGRMETR